MDAKVVKLFQQILDLLLGTEVFVLPAGKSPPVEGILQQEQKREPQKETSWDAFNRYYSKESKEPGLFNTMEIKDNFFRDPVKVKKVPVSGSYRVDSLAFSVSEVMAINYNGQIFSILISKTHGGDYERS